MDDVPSLSSAEKVASCLTKFEGLNLLLSRVRSGRPAMAVIGYLRGHPLAETI